MLDLRKLIPEFDYCLYLLFQLNEVEDHCLLAHTQTIQKEVFYFSQTIKQGSGHKSKKNIKSCTRK